MNRLNRTKVITSSLLVGTACAAGLYLSNIAVADGIPADSPLVYTGVLHDGNTPINGQRNFRLTLYDDPESSAFSNTQCVTQQNNVTLTDGHFHIVLDNSCVAAVQDNPDLWLETEINGQILGRTKLGAVPYAVEAERAASLTESAADLLVPPGTVVAFAGPIVPDGWLLADGSELSRAQYPRLFDVIGTAHGDGNGSSTFQLPDYRGMFLRGVDDGRGLDPNVSSRTAPFGTGNSGDRVGSIQEAGTARPSTAFTTNSTGSHSHSGTTSSAGAHTHNVNVRVRGNENGSGTQYTIANSGGSSFNFTTNSAGAHTHSFTTNSTGAHSHTITGGGDSETRPVNAYVNYIIKY